MMRGMPAIWEDTQTLRELMRQQTDARKLLRLQALYLIQTGQAKHRAEAAQLLGVYRETVGEWLALYEAGGWERMLSLGQAPGAASSLPAAVIAGMREKLATPAGVSSYQQLQQWVEQTYQLRTTYTVIYYTATQVLGARLAVPRPAHEKKTRAIKPASAQS